MRNNTKKCLESRMLRKLHVRFGVGVGVQSPGLHHASAGVAFNAAATRSPAAGSIAQIASRGNVIIPTRGIGLGTRGPVV